ncbi:class I SAM-dependent methyltransferase [Pseudonocardia sp. TRM90224]|uniref:class I SAM-dependent methyltransferase n=1 Tax=Pseudonocardia sp. TRM90224 TaxID=2812678 RepID=UPI001E42CE41|nr:class I SAM-dependent methyltransferase [Pseudonocardia sp. TRM90224]
MTTEWSEYADSAEYLHLLSKPMWTGMAGRLHAVLRGVDPAAGPVLELGAGTGLGTDIVLAATSNEVLAAEPAPGLRAVLLARLADRDEQRVTVLPCGALDVPLPERLAAVVGMHMVGHLPPDDRRRLWPELARRLAPDAPAVFNVQPPATATAVPAWPWTGATIGGSTYEGTGEAEPTGPAEVRWRMSYRTRRGETLLASARATYRWWTIDAESLAAELAEAGIEPTVDDDLVIGRATAG